MGVLFALLSGIGFALTYVLIRLGVRPDDPDSGLMITMLANVIILMSASVILWLVAPLPEVHPEAIIWFIVAGLLGPLAGRYTLFGGIRRIGSSRAAAIKNNAPIVVVVTGVVFLGEQFTLQALLGALLVLSGLLLLAYEAFTKELPGQNRDETPMTWALESEAAAEGAPVGASETRLEPFRRHLGSPAVTGIAMGILAAFAFGFSQVTRKLGLDITPIAVLGAGIGASAGLASYAAISLLQGRMGAIAKANFRTFRPVLWLAGATSATGILSFYTAVTMAPVSHVSVVAASETVLTIIFGAILARRIEAITSQIVIPALAVFGGTALLALA